MEWTAIEQQINRILLSQSFAAKAQLRKLLEILFQNIDCQPTLSHDQVIKELWPDEVRTKRSADVASEMNYYEDEGKEDSITITLPNRSAQSAEKRWIVATPRESSGHRATAPEFDRKHVARTVTLVVSACVLAVLAVALVRSVRSHPQPFSGRLEGTTLSILDKDGQQLWSKSFPDGFWLDFYDKRLAQRLLFEDLDGQGHTSVLFLYHPASVPRSFSTALICYSDTGQELWRWTLGRTLPELEGSPPTFRIIDLAVLREPGNRRPRLVVSGYHDPFYPHEVAVLDSNGKQLSEYWHSGHLDHLTLGDLNGDGKQQIVATGISNGYREGTLIVLDPDHMGGASVEQARPEIQIHGMGPGQEKIRLLFARSDLNKALYVYNNAEDSTVDHGRIRLSVRECFLAASCVVWYEFNQPFHLISAVADDQFRSAHAQFYINRKDAHPFTPKEEAGFQNVRCLAGCEPEFKASQSH
jgi:hypothetical protein